MNAVRRALKWIGIVIVVVALAGCVFLFVAYWLSTNDRDRNAAAPAHPMKAIRKCEYGVVTLREVEKPSPTENEILVKIRAASLNAADGHLLRGGIILRLFSGLRKPKDSRFGID